MPAASLPDRRTLAGPILKSLVADIEIGIDARMRGKYGTTQCDGWEFSKRTHLLGFMVANSNEVG